MSAIQTSYKQIAACPVVAWDTCAENAAKLVKSTRAKFVIFDCIHACENSLRTSSVLRSVCYFFRILGLSEF